MKKIISKLFGQKKLAYATPSFVVVDNDPKERYSFSDSWCYASESK